MQLSKFQDFSSTTFDYFSSKNVKFKAIHFESSKEAENAPAAVTSFCLFYNGEYITNEIPSENKFEKMITQM